MSLVQIPNLPVAISVTGTEQLEAVQSGTSVRVTSQQIANLSPAGTVTTVSVATANGVSGTVADPTSTPAITLTLGAITPTSVTTSGNVGVGTSSPSQLFDVNSDSIRVRTAKTPASASATGTQGQIAWDANYLYVCTATNTWKRSAITTW
jgi:hypothetical protein